MAYHTYEFLRRRKNEPKWRDAYLKAKWIRIISFLFTATILVWGIVVYKYVQQNDIDVTAYIQSLVTQIENLF